MVKERTRMLNAFLRNRMALFGLVVVMIMVSIAILAPFLSPHNPVRQSIIDRRKPPGTQGFLLGTDRYGRDMLSRVLHGSRVSITVGITSVLIGLVIGVPLGVISAYKGGWYDTILMRIADMALSIPSFVLGLIVVSLFGGGMLKVIISIAIVLSPRFARIARGPTLSLVESEYIQAARSLGASDVRIIMSHIIPNILGDIAIISTLWVATAIRIEAGLSFLGLGVQPPTPTWGNMVRQGIEYLGVAPWISIVPGIAIFFAIFSFNMIGDGLRDITDPKVYGN